MTRLTDTELAYIDEARVRGRHPDIPVDKRPGLTDLNAAQLRARAEVERARVFAHGFKLARAWLRGVLPTFPAALSRKRIELRTRRELEALDDTILRDIGLTRFEIHSEARKHAETVVPRLIPEDPSQAECTRRRIMIWPYLRLT